MNIDELYTVERHEKGSEMQVKDQQGKKLDFYITVAGMDSKKFRKSTTKLRREIVKDNNADMETLKADSLADVTLGWRGLTSKGKDIKFSTEQAKELYQNAPYIMEQVDSFIANRANFMNG